MNDLMKIAIGLLLIIQGVLLPPSALSGDSSLEGELWFQSVMYVHHYDQDAWDWVEGFDNKVVGLEYRSGQHAVGFETFINSFGDRTNAIHYTNSYYFSNGMSVGMSLGANHGYEPEYFANDECYNKRSLTYIEGGCKESAKVGFYLSDGVSLSSSLHVSYQYEAMEISLLTLGATALALKFSLQVF